MTEAASFARLSTDKKMEAIFSSIIDLRKQVEALSNGQISRLGAMAAKIDGLVDKLEKVGAAQQHGSKMAD